MTEYKCDKESSWEILYRDKKEDDFSNLVRQPNSFFEVFNMLESLLAYKKDFTLDELKNLLEVCRIRMGQIFFEKDIENQNK